MPRRPSVFYPETAGLSLELLDLAFMGKVEANPINESARLRKLLKTSGMGGAAATHELVMQMGKPEQEFTEKALVYGSVEI